MPNYFSKDRAAANEQTVTVSVEGVVHTPISEKDHP